MRKWLIYRKLDGTVDFIAYRKGASFRGRVIEIFTGTKDDAARRARMHAGNVFVVA